MEMRLERLSLATDRQDCRIEASSCTRNTPERILKVIEIYRTVFNDVGAGEDGRTPAMRPGLAEGRIRLEDIIYFEG